MRKMGGKKKGTKHYKNQTVRLGALHLPAVCKVKTTFLYILSFSSKLHLPAVCKVKTTAAIANKSLVRLHLPAVCKVKTTLFLSKIYK